MAVTGAAAVALVVVVVAVAAAAVPLIKAMKYGASRLLRHDTQITKYIGII